MQTIITVRDAAETLGCTVQRIRQMLDEGKLKGRKVGTVWMIDPKTLKREVEKRERAHA